jgi:hypothetical protein
MTDTWLPLSDAEERVNKLTKTYLGRQLIKDALEKGHIRSRAGTFVERVPSQSPHYKKDELLPPDFWRTAEIHSDPNGGVANQYTFIGKDEFEKDLWTTCEAHNIHLLIEDLIKCWPDLPLSDPAQPPDLASQPTVRPIKRKKGGRPPMDDWIKAAAYAVAYIIEQDPEPPELRKALTNWFNSNFAEQPDIREVERFVRALFDELKNLKWPVQ